MISSTPESTTTPVELLDKIINQMERKRNFFAKATTNLQTLKSIISTQQKEIIMQTLERVSKTYNLDMKDLASQCGTPKLSITVEADPSVAIDTNDQAISQTEPLPSENVSSTSPANTSSSTASKKNSTSAPASPASSTISSTSSTTSTTSKKSRKRPRAPKKAPLENYLDATSEDDLKSFKVKKLKEILKEAGAESTSRMKKPELRKMVWNLVQNKKKKVSPSSNSTSAKTTENSERESASASTPNAELTLDPIPDSTVHVKGLEVDTEPKKIIGSESSEPVFSTSNIIVKDWLKPMFLNGQNVEEQGQDSHRCYLLQNTDAKQSHDGYVFEDFPEESKLHFKGVSRKGKFIRWDKVPGETSKVEDLLKKKQKEFIQSN